jgi:PBP1b-binding outer membrane lipoprotein LpoB
MIRSSALAAVAALALLAAGCGSSGEPAVSAATANAAVAKAAGVRLTQAKLPDEAAKQGLQSAASNSATASDDGQLVFVFTLDDAGKVDKLSGELRDSVGSGAAQLFTHENVVVVYGAVGSDHGKAVRAALEGLDS